MAQPGDQGFAAAVSLARVPRRAEGTRVDVDWRELPAALAATVPGVTWDAPIVRVGDDGSGLLELHGTTGEANVNVTVAAYGDGPSAARRGLETRGDLTMRGATAYVPAARPLGDVAAIVRGRGEAAPRVLWLYGNVVGWVRRDDGGDAWPVAAAVQAFMQNRLGTDLAARRPAVERLLAEPTDVRVGERVTLRLEPASAVTEGLVVRLADVSEALRDESWDGRTGTLRAVAAGQGQAVVTVLDPGSLLARRLVATVVVRP